MADILPLPYKLELAFGADKTASPASWSWVDVTNRTTTGSRVKLYDQDLTLQVGSSDESRQVQPSTTKFTLNDFDGAVVPGNAVSPWYPNVRRGTPCRISVNAGDPHLSLPGVNGSYASTPDHASLDITGDIFVALDATIYGGTRPTAAMHLASKWNTVGSLSWRVYYSANGAMQLSWSVTGSAIAGDEGNLIPLPISLTGRLVWAVSLDVNDGAGGHVVTWYTAESIAGPWTIHETRTVSGTTSIFSSSAILEIGTQTNGTATVASAPFHGEIHAFEHRSGGTGGTIVANPDFAAQPAGTTSFSDSAGRTWTVNGTATIDAWQRRFVGEVGEISPRWPAGNLPNNAEVDVTAAGVLRRLTQGAKTLQSSLRRKITAPLYEPNIIAYWPFEDGSDSEVIGSPTPGVDPMTISGAFSFAADSTLPSSSPLLTVGNGETAYMEAAIPAIPQVVGVNWMVARLFRIDDPAVGGTQLMAVDTTGRVATWRVTINDAQVVVTGVDADDVGVVLDTIPTDSRFYDTFAFVMLRVNDDGANVDWELHVIPIPLGLDFSTSGTYVGNTGVPVMFRNNLVGPPSGVTVGHLVVTTGVSVAFTAPADTAFVGEPASARIRRLCEEEAIPVTIDGPCSAAWDDVPETVQRMGPQRVATLVDLLKEAAEVDQGVLAEMRTLPGVAYRTRTTIENQPTRLTWDASARGVINPFEPTLDDQRISNDFTASRVDGSAYRVTDPASIETDGIYADSVNLNVASDTQLPDQAGWRLRLGTWPGMRYPSLPLELDFAADLTADWVNLALGDRVQVTNLPSEHPTGPVDVLVEGYDETFSQWGWSPELNCSPAEPHDVGIVEDDDYGRVDTEGSELAVAVNSSATSLSVATTEWPPWRTQAGGAVFPFTLDIAGEEVDVTDLDDVLVTFGATGTVTHANNASVTPGTPAGIAAGNLLIILAAIRNSGTGTPDTPAGYTRWPVFADDANVAVFAKIAVGGDTAPAITFTGGVANADTSAQMIRIAGDFYSAGNALAAWGSTLNASAQDIFYPGTRVPYDNCIVIYLGWKQDDWTSVATIAGATEIGEPDTTTGDDQGICWDYVIQTTGADIAPGSFIVTGGASAISRGGVIAVRSDRQTLTVTRSSNGVSKSHSVGESVSLATPMIAAM